MFDNSIRILNFDDSVVKQSKLLSRYAHEIIDLRPLGPSVRLFMDAKARQAVLGRINSSPKNSINFLGSGDFHHISELLISRFDEPISVIDFDLHPDWDILPPRYGCGSWVSPVLKRDNIAKFVLLGASSTDIDSFSIQRGNLNSLRDNRVEIYPYAHKPSSVFLKKIPANVSINIRSGALFNKIYWDELKNKDLNNFMKELLGRFRVKKVYISIDKDCLTSKFALTNWEEGLFSLDQLLLVLKLIKENTEIVAADITGEYSPILIKGLFKKFASYLDHPKKVKAQIISQAEVNAVNEETNLRIMQVLG